MPLVAQSILRGRVWVFACGVCRRGKQQLFHDEESGAAAGTALKLLQIEIVCTQSDPKRIAWATERDKSLRFAHMPYLILLCYLCNVI